MVIRSLSDVDNDRCSRIRYNSKKFSINLDHEKRNQPMTVSNGGSLLSGGCKHTPESQLH